MHRVHGKDHPRDERGRPVRPATRECRDQECGTRMPQQVHRMEQRGVTAGQAPVQRERGERERPVHLTAQIGRPVGATEGAPRAVQGMHQRIPDNDVEIVHREAVPQRRDIWNERACRHNEVEAAVFTVHGSWQRASVHRATGRSR